VLTYDQQLPLIGVQRSSPSDRTARRSHRLRSGVTPADLGLNQLSKRLLSIQAGALLFIGLLYAWLGLSCDWATLAPHCIGIGIVALVWLYYYWQPGKRSEWVIAEGLFVLLLIMTLALIVSSGQYVAASLGRPLIDTWLAATDAAIGVSVPGLVDWTRAHANIASVLRYAYFTLVPQFLLTVVVVGFICRDRPRIWEFTFHFHFCALATLAAFAFLPANEPGTYYRFETIIDQGRFLHQFQSLRAGTFVIHFDDMEGLVSFPSFHVAGALLVTWTFRKYRWLRWPLVALNISLIAATFMTGIHFVADAIGALPMFAASLCAYRYCGFAALFDSVPGCSEAGMKDETLAGVGEIAGRNQTTENVIAADQHDIRQSALNQARIHAIGKAGVATSCGNAVADWIDNSAHPTPTNH
jgi:hypothetical protein